METTETGGETEGTLEFDFLFDEVDLLTNQETTEIPSNHQDETAAKISTDKGDDQSDEAQENPHEVDTILNASQVVELQKHGGANCEISSRTTSFVNALNLAQQGLLIAAPPPPPPPTPTPQPYSPSAEKQVTMAYPSSYNQSGNPTCTQLVPVTSITANAWETSRPSSTPFSWTTAPQPPFSSAPAPTMGHDGVVQTPFQTVDQREANQLQMINYPVPYQQQPNINFAAYNPNDQNVNVPHQFDNLPLSQNMGPMSQLGTNNQLVQNITNNNFIPYNQQQPQHQPPALYPPPNSFPPQNLITGPVGGPNQIRSDPLMNQQQPIFAPQLLNHPAAYRPSTTPQLGYYWPQQTNQVMPANVTDPQFMALPPQQATSLRHAQQLPNQPQQMASNFYDPNCVYTMQPGYCMPPIRPQTIPYQYQQLNQAPVAPNSYDPQVYNTMQPAEISTNAWPPQFGYPNYQQPNDQMRPIVQDSFLPAGSSMPSRIQPLNNDAQVNQGQMIQMMPNVVVPQLSNSMLPADHHQQPLMKSTGLLQKQFSQVPMKPTVCNPLQNSLTVTGPSTLSRPSDQLVQQMEATQMMMPNATDCSSILSTPSIISKPPQASDHHQRQQQQVNIGTPMMGSADDHTPHDPQLDNSAVDHPALESSSVHSRQNTVQLQERLNNRPTFTKPTAAVPSYQTYVINSLTERERRDQNTYGVAIPTQSKPSTSKLKDQRTSERVERRARKAGKRKEVGDSSSVPAKRSKTEAAGRQEKRSSASKSSAADQQITVVNNKTPQSEENEVNNSSVSDPLVTLRRVRNACYDPRFEAMGLPIDPHIRMFTRH